MITATPNKFILFYKTNSYTEINFICFVVLFFVFIFLLFNERAHQLTVKRLLIYLHSVPGFYMDRFVMLNEQVQ